VLRLKSSDCADTPIDLQVHSYYVWITSETVIDPLIFHYIYLHKSTFCLHHLHHFHGRAANNSKSNCFKDTSLSWYVTPILGIERYGGASASAGATVADTISTSLYMNALSKVFGHFRTCITFLPLNRSYPVLPFPSSSSHPSSSDSRTLQHASSYSLQHKSL